MAALTAIPLTWEHCVALAPRISHEDTLECLAMGHTPIQALAGGCMLGEGFAVIRSDSYTPVGAFGWTTEGTIWSLWSELSPKESAQVLRDTGQWVRTLVMRSPFEELHNHVATANGRALKWLRRSGAFWVQDEDAEDDRGFLYFETRPLGTWGMTPEGRAN